MVWLPLLGWFFLDTHDYKDGLKPETLISWLTYQSVLVLVALETVLLIV